MTSTFQGWPPSMVDFYSRLEVDNSREFWQANRTVYDRDVRGPMEALVAELADEFGDAKVFRPNRDVRFSKDKAPYKTEVAAVFHTADQGGFYVKADADGLAAGGGYYHMARDQLARFRTAIDDDRTGPQLVALVAGLEQADGYDVAGESLKTAPRGWPKDHPRIELLRRKGLVWLRMTPPGPQVHTGAALDFVRDAFRTGAPLLGWLDAHVGPSAEAPGRR